MQRILHYILTLAIIAGLGFVGYAQETPKKKVAVYMTGEDANESYKKVIGAKLVSAITESGEYAAVERTADFLEALTAENDYQASGEVRDSQIAALGQKFGVKFVVVADVSEVFDEYFITARIINVETGLVEKACNVSGSAESMSQLITLSTEISNKLFGDISSSTSNSTIPIHLSLCVTDVNGKTQYISAEQWETMSHTKRLTYMKKGVVISDNGVAFLVGMRDVGTLNWMENYNCTLPSIRQLQLIYKYLEQLNPILQIYGGEPFQQEWYWTNESYNSSEAYCVSLVTGLRMYLYKGGIHRIRTVAPVPSLTK